MKPNAEQRQILTWEVDGIKISYDPNQPIKQAEPVTEEQRKSVAELEEKLRIHGPIGFINCGVVKGGTPAALKRIFRIE